jgi:Ca2+-dependent lipid-binding protein
LIEIVSGWDLPVGDFVSSDPFVICMLGRREVHRTKHVPQTLDPIWTIKNGSLFLLSVESKELFIQEGLQLLVKDFDQFGGNEMLGLVKIPPEKLYNANGERMEFKLQPVPGKKEEDTPGYLAIRCRRATDYDKKFMKGYEESIDAVATPEHHKTANSAIRSIITRQYKVDQGEKKVSYDVIFCIT